MIGQGIKPFLGHRHFFVYLFSPLAFSVLSYNKSLTCLRKHLVLLAKFGVQVSAHQHVVGVLPGGIVTFVENKQCEDGKRGHSPFIQSIQKDLRRQHNDVIPLNDDIQGHLVLHVPTNAFDSINGVVCR